MAKRKTGGAELPYSQRLMIACDLYCELTNVSQSTLSNYLFKDGKKLGQIKAKETGLTMARYTDAVRWLEGNWPEGQESKWPKEVEKITWKAQW